MATIVPYWYQREAVASIFAYFRDDVGNPLVALPGGTGKSVVIATFIKEALQMWPTTRFLCLTHIKELIEQNAERCVQAWPEAPVGIYSAGLKRRDVHQPIIFGGVASVVGCIERFGWRDLVIIDECHLLGQNDDSMYGKIINALKLLNPNLKVVGLTATPYRLGQGKLTDSGLFTHICYDMTNMSSFERLVSEGFLCAPTNKKTSVEVNSTGVKIVGGDYDTKQMTAAVSDIMVTACQELVYRAADRVSWIVFVPGVENTESIAELLRSYGIAAEAIHSKLKPTSLRDQRIADFRSFKIRAVVVNNMLTTGFDHKPTDCLAIFRKTTSTGLWIQMLYRGSRPSPETGKTNFLVLDFAGNTRTLGPINDPVLPRKKGAKGGGDAPVRICDVCGTYNHTSKRNCECCGKEFDFSPKVAASASSDVIYRVPEADTAIVENLEVKSILYSRHLKKGGIIPCMKVQYLTGFQSFTTFVHLEQPFGTMAKKEALDWWRERHSVEPPATVSEALTYQSALRAPKRINVVVNRKYPEVLSYEY